MSYEICFPCAQFKYLRVSESSQWKSTAKQIKERLGYHWEEDDFANQIEKHNAIREAWEEKKEKERKKLREVRLQHWFFFLGNVSRISLLYKDQLYTYKLSFLLVKKEVILQRIEERAEYLKVVLFT